MAGPPLNYVFHSFVWTKEGNGMIFQIKSDNFLIISILVYCVPCDSKILKWSRIFFWSKMCFKSEEEQLLKISSWLLIDAADLLVYHYTVSHFRNYTSIPLDSRISSLACLVPSSLKNFILLQFFAKPKTWAVLKEFESYLYERI